MKQTTFVVVSKKPDCGFFAPGSSIGSPPDPDRMVCQVLLRFEPKREDHHPDDNDLRLICAPDLCDRLAEGSLGTGTWEKDRLLAFEPFAQ